MAPSDKVNADVELLRGINRTAEIITTPVEKLSGKKLLEIMEKHDNTMEELLEEAKKAAESEAEALTARTESAVRQAARDIILELQSELELRIRRAVEGAAEQALSADFMAGLIRELAAKFAAAPGSAISVLTAVKDVPALENALRGALASSLHTDPQVFGSTGIKGGLEVSFRDGEVYFDFTSGAVTELVGEYIGPRLAKLLAGDDK